MPLKELQGLTGNGIRKCAQGRRTATTATIEIWLGNVTDLYYNTIHGTSIVNGADLQVNKTAAEIVIEAPDVPVASERLQVYKTTPGAGETKIGDPVNVTDDPVVQTDSSGNFYNDPIDWYGLGKRVCTFTGLEDRWYTAWVETNLVASHGDGACKRVKIRFRPKRADEVRIENIGCSEGVLTEYNQAVDATDPYIPFVPIAAARRMVHEGVDYVVTGDDFNYCANAGRADWWWRLPRDSSGSSVVVPAGTYALSMFANNINVGDQLTDEEYLVVWENLCSCMNPFYVYLGYHSVVVPTGIGDHAVRRFNGIHFGIFSAYRASISDYMLVDYGLAADNTVVRPNDSATSLWVHDGNGFDASGNVAVAADPYDQAGNPVQANIIDDMVKMEAYRTCVMTLFDLLWYNRFEHNLISSSPTTMQVPAYITNMPELSAGDPTAAVGAGGLAVPAEYYYYPRIKYMDIGSVCRVYAVDQSFFSYGRHDLEVDDDSVPLRDGVPASVSGTVQTMGSTALAELIAHMEADAANFNCYVLVTEDVTYPTQLDGLLGVNGDAMGRKSPAEHALFVASIEGLPIPCFLMTSDEHVTAVTNYVAKVVEAHASSGSTAYRDIDIPASHNYVHQISAMSSHAGTNRFYANSLGASLVCMPSETGDILAFDEASDMFFAVDKALSSGAPEREKTLILGSGLAAVARR